MNEAYKELRDELNKTAVISSDFKSAILSLTQWAMQIAYENGKKDAIPKG